MHFVFDFDSTIAKTHEAVLKLYRENTGDYGTKIDDKNLVWNMSDVCRFWTQEQVDDCFVNPNLFKHMEPFDKAVDKLYSYHKEGHLLEICSMHKKDGIKNKHRYIKSIMPFIDIITIIPLDDGLQGFDKSMTTGDIFVDDRIDALTSSKCIFKILYGDYTWNKDYDGIRAYNWDDVDYYIKHYQDVICKFGEWFCNE